MSTTAEGDGLEFDRRLGTIFDEIAMIKQTFGSEEKTLESIIEEIGFKLEDIPSNVTPASLLIQAIENLE